MLLPLKNVIVLESKPDFADNTKAVFDEMIKRRVNEKWKLVWVVSKDKQSFPKLKNVRYINPDKNALQWKLCVKNMTHNTKEKRERL